MLNYWSFQKGKKCVKCAPLLAQSGTDIANRSISTKQPADSRANGGCDRSAIS